MTNSTVARLLRPAPAIIVSSIWLSNVSPASSTAAIPPCAQPVAPSESEPFASTATLKRSARLSAAVSPAAPEPMMMMSYSANSLCPRQVQENMLEIGLARRHIDNTKPCRAER